MNQSGLVLLFFVDMEPMLLFPAIPCLGAGGFTLLTSNFQLAMLTNIAGLVVLAIQAGFGASGTIFRVFFSGEPVYHILYMGRYVRMQYALLILDILYY